MTIYNTEYPYWDQVLRNTFNSYINIAAAIPPSPQLVLPTHQPDSHKTSQHKARKDVNEMMPIVPYSRHARVQCHAHSYSLQDKFEHVR